MNAATGAPAARGAWARAAVVLAVVLAADQIVKALVTGSLARGEEREIVAFAKLVNTRNTGVAFGQLQNGGTIVSVVIAIALIGLLVFFVRNAWRPLVWLCLLYTSPSPRD